MTGKIGQLAHVSPAVRARVVHHHRRRHNRKLRRGVDPAGRVIEGSKAHDPP